ncbi:MAG: peptide deformylase, partial [Candidatus Omnitrophota bacterium]
MAETLSLVTYGAGVLRKEGESIVEVTEEIRRLGKEMLEVMYAEGGIGLAAPQVGLSKRLFVVDGSNIDPAIRPMVLMNPEISKSEGKEVEAEGCLSLPGLEVEVKRAQKIHVRAMDLEGEIIDFDAKGFFARIIQHEIDHLNGILLLDYLNPVERVLAVWKLRKKLKGILQ